MPRNLLLLRRLDEGLHRLRRGRTALLPQNQPTTGAEMLAYL
jgi:hypothetical protein